MKTIFIVTGFKQAKHNAQFKWMRPYFSKLGFEVKVFAADWDYRVMSDYLSDFELFYAKNKSEQNYVLGFSFGAMIALLSARTLQPDRLYLCSLSPYFKEDIQKIRKTWERLIGVRRKRDFQLHSAKKASQQLIVPTVVLYGEAEGVKFPNLKKRCEYVADLLPKSTLVVVKDASHKIDHPEYIRVIKELFVK
jgi:pimeloyl-ACP methyl ester carboxylesterase